ncbi:MAG: cytochrome P450 [Acidimicrobiia bacterium]|nr:cytochrome P450 [Acidimicrobiia bacterium]
MTVTPGIEFDPYDRAFLDDPYPTYARLREEAPVAYDAERDLTFFARHDDVTAVLRDARFGRRATHRLDPQDLSRPEVGSGYPTWERFVRGSFIDLEPPEHTRLRALVAPAFRKRSAELLRPLLDATADRLLDELLERDAVDMIADYATPIPVEMITALMGVPEADHPMLLDWSHAIVRLFDYDATPDEGEAAERAVGEFVAYLRPIVRRRRAEPGDDLISQMAAARHDGEPYSDDDVVATAILTLNAGHEATVHAIGNAVLALGRHPDVFAALRDEPSLVPGAAEELLRYDTPLQMFERWVLEDVDWRGHRLERGTKVGLLFGSANRDAEVFDDPDRIVPTRDHRLHVSFGGGVHHCVGAPLARVELEVALGALVRRVARIGLESREPERIHSLVFRGVTSLPALLQAA